MKSAYFIFLISELSSDNNVTHNTLQGNINTVSNQVVDTNNKIGNLSDLTTSSKTSVVSAINDIKNITSDEVTNRINADNLLQTQINNIVSPSGTSPNPTEIVDARVGFNGITYNTLGESIRDQISAVVYTINNPFTFTIYSSNNRRNASDLIEAPSKLKIIQTDNSYQFYVNSFSDKKILVAEEGGGNWVTSAEYNFDERPEVYYIQIIMRKATNYIFNSNTEGVGSLIIDYQKRNNDNKYNIVKSFDFIQGVIDIRGKVDVTTRITTSDIIIAKKGSCIYCPSGYKFFIAYFNEYGEYLSETEWLSGVRWYRFEDDCYCTICIANTSNTDIDTYTASLFNFYILQPAKSDVDLTVISLPLIGDCMLLQFKTANKNMLIDLGRSADYTLIKNKVKGLCVKKIDYFMISHYHDDHISSDGLTSLISEFDLSACTVLLPPTIPNSYVGNQWTSGSTIRSMQSSIISILETNGIAYKTNYYPQGQLNMYLGDVKFKLYNYDQNDFITNNVDYNELSLIALMENNNIKVLFTGDMMKTLETKMKDLLTDTIDIVKFGHHGLNQTTNIDIDFWHKIKPKLFFSSSPSDMTQYGNLYPTSSQIKFANYNGIQNIMTGISGDLYFHITKDSYSVNGENYKLDNLTLSEFQSFTGFNS